MPIHSPSPASLGKIVGEKRYLHVDTLPAARTDASGMDPLIAAVAKAEELAGVRRGEHFNLVRCDAGGGTLALLYYPKFYDEPFPSLAASWRVDLAAGTVGFRTYADSLNPPILHRKELLLVADDTRRDAWAALTAACEEVGLFDEPRRIGYRRQWDQLVHERGYVIVDHALVPIGNDDAGDVKTDTVCGTVFGDSSGGFWASPPGWAAARHRTALSRYGFSAPIQSLMRHGLLDGSLDLFDYGCGRGDDLRRLRENGIEAMGWDPYFKPDEPLLAADIVNLGFVINVIEDFDERLEALTRAWSLARRLLVVSVMLANQNDPRGERFRDGVMTRRGTFQKYFTQAEIKAFLEDALDEKAIPVAPGVHYIFRDKEAEQRLLVNRYRGRRNLLRLSSRRESDRSFRPGRPRRDYALERYHAHRNALERLWALRLETGRDLDKAETPDRQVLTDGFGSVTKALRFIVARKTVTLGEEAIRAVLESSAEARRDDLLVYFALAQFGLHKPYKRLEPCLKRDIKVFFGDYSTARTSGLALLMQLADEEAIEQACRTAVEHGLGWLDQQNQDVAEVDRSAPLCAAGNHGAVSGSPPRARSLTLDSTLVERLPALLRTYIGAAAAAYGDYQNADLIKIHIGSGKLTLMRFDDFHGQPLPRMLERVKIKMREQDIEFYSYGGDYPPPYLYRKSRFLNEEDPKYPEQVAFDEALEGLGIFDLSGFGPSAETLDTTLRRHRWMIDDFILKRGRWTPALDDPCGRFLIYRDLIECGETQQAANIPNLPAQIESYDALLALAEQVLDPIIDWFGMIRLTYGFCSPALARAIRDRGGGPIDPKRDQHAAHERNRLGNFVCERLGAAVDFIVEEEDMLEVARWVVHNTPFDRLYFYGRNRPIHVSHHTEQKGQVVLLQPTKAGRLFPKVVSKDAL